MVGCKNNLDHGSAGRAVVESVARRREMTVAELVDELGVTTTAVRQQVYKLVADGWLRVSKRRRGPGRPADVLSLSDQARELFAGGQADELAKSLINVLFEREDVGKVRLLLQCVSKRMAADLRRAVGETPPEQRVHRLAELLRERGLLVDADVHPGGGRLNVFTCPYPDMAGAHRELCEMEREALRDASGNEVTLEQCMLDGHRCCSFHLFGVAAGAAHAK